MHSDDVARLQRVAYARSSSDDERMHARDALARLDAEAAQAERAARAAAGAKAGRQQRLAARKRRRRARLLVGAAVAATVALGSAGVALYESSTGGSIGLGAGSVALGGRATPAATSPDASASAADTDSAASAAASAAPGSTSERFGSDGYGPFVPVSRAQQSAAQALSPARIFSTPQTAADHPSGAIPDDTLPGSYRLLSRGQYTPGSAFAAMTPDGHICLVVFGGGSDFGETCQTAAQALDRGLQADVTTVTNLNPRSGSNLITVAHYAASWGADGTFDLAVDSPNPAGSLRG